MIADRLTSLRSPFRLEAVRRTGLLDDPLPSEIGRLLRLACRCVPAPASAFLLLSGDGFHCRASLGLPASLANLAVWPLDWPFLLDAALEGPLFVSAAAAGARFETFPGTDFPAFAGLPLADDEGNRLGVFCAWNSETKPWDENQIHLLREFAGACGDLLARRLAALRHADALAQSAERFRIAMENGNDLIYDLDMASGRVEWIGPVDELLGWEPGGFPRTLKAWEKIIHPEDRKRVSAAVSRHLETREPFSEEYRVVARDGSERVWSDRGKALWDSEGRSHRWIGAVTDVTEKLRMGRELRETRDRMEVILTTLDAPVIARDASGRIVFANAGAARCLGFASPEALLAAAPDEIRGRFEIFDEAGRPMDPARLPSYQAMGTKRHDGAVMRYRTKGTGEEHWAMVKSIPALDDEGEVRLVITVFHDVTQLKKTEAELARSRDELKVILRSMDTSVVAIDAAGRTVFANDAAARMFDYRDAEEFLGAPRDKVLERYEILDSELAPFRPGETPTLRALRGEATPETVMCYRVKATGEVRWSLVRSTPVFDSEGKVRLAITLFHDVTQLKKTEAELARNRDELEVILRTMDNALTTQDAQGELVHANEAAARMLGFATVEDLMRTGARAVADRFDLLDGEGKAIPVERLPGRRALQGESVSGEVMGYRVKATGEERWSLVNATPVFDALGNVRFTVNIFNDITAIKRAERQVKDSRDQLEVILSGVDAAIFVADVAGGTRRLLYANQAAARAMEFASPDAMLGATPETFAARYHLMDADGNPLPIEKSPGYVAAQGKRYPPTVVRYRMQPSNQERWAVIKAVPIFEPDGRVKMVVHISQDITDIRHAEESLRLSETRLSLIFNNVSDMLSLIAVEPDGVFRLLMVNLPFLAQSRLPAERLKTGVRLDELLPPDTLGEWIRRYRRVIDGRQPVTETSEVVSFQKRTILETRLTPIFDDAGRCSHVLGVSRDITGKWEAEEGQRKHLRYLEAVDGVSRALEKAQETERELPAALARALESLDGRRIWLIHPADPEAAEFRAPFSATAAAPAGSGEGGNSGGTVLPAGAPVRELLREALEGDEPHVYGPDRPLPGAAFWLEAFRSDKALTAVLRPQVGRPWLCCVLREAGDEPWDKEDAALFKDVASRIAGALGSMILYRDLRRSEENYRTLFERSLDGIYRCGPDGTVLDANPALIEMLGYADRTGLVGTVQKQLLPGGGTVSGLPDRSEVFPVELLRKDGGMVWAEVNSQAIRRADGELAYFEGIVRNINDRKRTEEALKASEEKLRQSQKMEAVGRLAGGVAHDFNNLLTAINGFSDLLLMNVPPGDSRRGHVEEIRKAGERAASLTGQLLAFSRKQVLAPRLLDLNVVVTGMQTMLRRLIGENIDFQIRLANNPGMVLADPGQVEQIILNLALNSRDAMPSGGELVIGTARARLAPEGPQTLLETAPGDYVMLTVSDTGSGMDAETKARLFEPFFTTKPKDKGTGLGLSMVYGAVKQANGTMALESEPGRGTVFRVYLPAAQDAGAGREPRRPTGKSPSPMRGNETILLVEDEDAVRRLVRDVLEANGYTVLDAPGGEKALELAARHRGDIQLLLTDVVMGGMNGRELAERLNAARPATKVLFMSGYTEDAIIRHGVMAASTAFLGKPFTPAVLAAKVREVLSGIAAGAPPA